MGALYVMNICGYCGKANGSEVLFCAGCGSALELPKEPGTPSALGTKQLQRTLNAKIATIILLTYLAAGLFGSGFPGGLLLGFVFGAIAMVLTTLKLIPKHVKDASPTGAAWVRGRWESIAKGFAIGLIVGLCDQYFIIIAKHFVAHRSLDSLNRMASTPGFTQAIWLMTTLFLAPPVEEMMFRGVLYGGYRKSFGPLWAAVSTTLLFVMLHFPEFTHFPSNIIPMIVVTLVMLWCRLHWSAIGPAVAVHLGYNLMVALTMVYWTWR